MIEQLVDALFLVFFCAVLFGVAGFGTLSLPWRDEELDATTHAIRGHWRRLDHALRRVSERGVRREPRRMEASTVAFEPPSIPAA